jgi:hypothetical protein
MAEGKVKNSGEDMGVLVAPLAKSLKRSKRREGTVDEDSSARAEWLKVKRNLDGPGTLSSKFFLSFPDSKVVGNITSLGVSLGKDVANGIACLKET